MDYNSSPGGQYFGGLYFGPNKYKQVVFSFFGPAVENEEGRYFAYERHPGHDPDQDRLVDVTETISENEGLNNFFFWFPVRPTPTTLSRGDLFVVAGTQPLFYFVKSVDPYGNIVVLDPQSLTSTTYVTPDNLLHFQFVNKALSLVSGNGIDESDRDFDEIFLLLALSNQNMENNPLAALLLARALGGDDFSPFGRRSQVKQRRRHRGLREILPFLLLSGSGQPGGMSNALLPILLAENLEEEEEEEGVPGGKTGAEERASGGRTEERYDEGQRGYEGGRGGDVRR